MSVSKAWDNKEKKQDSTTDSNKSKVKNRTATSQQKFDAAKSFSDETDTNSDDIKYQLAVEDARNNLADKENVTDEELKSEIDEQLKKYGASKTGSELRGENGFTKSLDAGRNFINNLMLGGGNVLDGFFDSTIGNLAGAIGGEDAANDVKGWFNGEDLQGVVDIATDIGLAALGPAGWAAMVGKNALQQSDNIMQGLNGGKDRITREDIGFEGGAASLLEGLGGTALAAVPVIGKARNLGKLAKLAAEESAPKAISKAAVKDLPKAGQIEETANKAGKFNMKKPNGDDILNKKTFENESIDQLPSTSSAIENVMKNASDLNYGMKTPKAVVEDVVKETPYSDLMRRAYNLNPFKRIDSKLAEMSEIGKRVDKAAAKTKKEADIAKRAEEGKRTIGDRIYDTKKKITKDDGPGIVSHLGNSVGGAVSGALGANQVGVNNTGNPISTDDILPAAITGAVAGLLGKNNGVSIRGNKARISPAIAYSLMGGMKAGDNITRGVQPEAMSDEEILEALKVR